MTNGQEGQAFERRVRQYLAGQGYWVTKLQEGKNGAPFDLLAVRDHRALAVECKVCASLRFPLGRVEDNQWSGMKKFQQTAGDAVLVLLAPSGEVCVYPFDLVLAQKRRGKSALAVLEAPKRWEVP